MRWCIGLLLAVMATAAAAEQYVDAGPYRVHYAALNTSDLAPAVARQFGIRRTRNQILLVLNPQKRVGGRYVPVPATATGTATTLIGHVETLKLHQVHEADVHYVIGTFETLDGEFMTISAQVLPEGSKTPVQVEFRQQFFRD